MNWQYSAATLFLSVFLSGKVQVERLPWPPETCILIMSFYVYEKEEKRTWKWSCFGGWWAIAVPGDIWGTLTHSTVVIILFLRTLWKEFFLKEIGYTIKRVNLNKHVCSGSGYLPNITTPHIQKANKQNPGPLQIILWSPQWSFLSWICLSWVILLYLCGPGWKQVSHGLSTHINHSEKKIWAITTKKLFF